MNGHHAFQNMRSEKIFQAFKYIIYTLIGINVMYFIAEDYLATDYTFRNGIAWQQLGDAFATSIDSFAWLVLLLLFELETYTLSDERLKGRLKWVMSALVAICYSFIVIAFIGYVDRLDMVQSFLPVVGTACDHVGDVLSYAIGFDDYAELTSATCTHIPAGGILVNDAISILSDEATLDGMFKLALTDVINAGAWLLVVVVLQIDVILQLEGELTRRLYTINLFIKTLVYSALILACLYWAYLGAALDVWDAFLWIVAFVFIELNLFKWHEASEREAA